MLSREPSIFTPLMGIDGNVMLTNLVWKGQSWVDIRNRDVFLKKQEVPRHCLQIFCVCLYLWPSSTINDINRMKIWKMIKKSKLNSPQHDKRCVFWRHSTVYLAFDNDENIAKFNGRGVRVQLGFFLAKAQCFKPLYCLYLKWFWRFSNIRAPSCFYLDQHRILERLRGKDNVDRHRKTEIKC